MRIFEFSGPLPENTKMLTGIIPDPYKNGAIEPETEYTDEILCHEGRKETDRREDETPADTTVWGLSSQDGD